MKNFKKLTELGFKLALAFGFLISTVLPFAAIKAAPAPVPGNPGWDKAYSTNKNIPVLDPSLGPDKDLPNNPRDNAAGDKITSNAHSADYPGLYFYWDDKQKDDGVLLVNEDVFDYFESGEFTLTAKNSNNYWGYSIAPDSGFEVKSGTYAYRISKQIKYNEVGNNGKVSAKTDDLKNINMVFIDGKYKDAYVRPVKTWLDEEGKDMTDPKLTVTFKDGFVLDIEKKITINTFAEAVNGKKVSVTEDPIPGYKALKNPVTVTVTAGERADAKFTNQKLYAKITLVKNRELLTGSVAPDAVFNIYDLDDNPIEGPVGPGTYQVKAGTYKVVEESIDNFSLIKVTNNGVVTVDAGETKTVTFTNKENDPPLPTTAEVSVIKKWIGTDGEEMLNAPVTATLTNGWVFGSTGVVLGGKRIYFQENTIKDKDIVVVGDWIDVEESTGDWSTTKTEVDGGNVYIQEERTITQEQTQEYIETTYKFHSVSINGGKPSNRNRVRFTAKAGKTYDIIFTNKVVEDAKTKKITKTETECRTKILRADDGKKITSDEHADDWWKKLGLHIIAVGANTTDDGNYVVALGKNVNDTVYIGYGSDASKLDYIFSFDKDGNRDVIKGGFIGEVNIKPETIEIEVEIKIEVGNGNTRKYPVDIIYTLTNPRGKGKRHIYLLEVDSVTPTCEGFEKVIKEVEDEDVKGYSSSHSGGRSTKGDTTEKTAGGKQLQKPTIASNTPPAKYEPEHKGSEHRGTDTKGDGDHKRWSGWRNSDDNSLDNK